MGKVSVQVDVEQSSYDVAQAAGALVKKLKDASVDGLSITEVVAIVSSEFSALTKAAQELKDIPAESKDDLAAFLKSWSIAGADLAGELLAPKLPAA